MMGKSRKSGKGIGEVGGKRSGKKRFERVERVFADEKREEAGTAARGGLEKTFDAISDWVCLMDTKWHILRSNEAGERFTGLGTEEMVGQLCCKLVHGSEKPLAGCPLKKMLKTGRRETTELKVPGEDRWLAVTVDPVKDGKGKVTGAVHIVRDITEEKRAEAALQESEENYRLLFESSAVGVGVSLPDGRILAANERIQQIMGYSLEEFKKVNIADVYANVEDRKRLLEILKRDGRVKNYEARLKRKNGEVYWASLSINKAEVRGEERLLTTQIDITRRKEAEETLRESEERFRQVVENSQEWIWEVDANGLYIYASPVAEKVFGYKPEEIIGKKHFYDLFHPEDRKELKKQAFAVFAKKQAFRGFINRNVHKNGQTIWLSTSGIPVLDERENLLGYRGADADITERKRAEEKLAAERNLLRTLIDNMPDEIYVKDTDTRFILCNRTVAEHHGVSSPDELIGKTDFDLYPGEVAERYCAVEQQIMRSGEPKVKFFETYLDSKGNEVWGLNTKMPLRDSEGKVIGIVGIGRDVAQEKKAEKALIEERNLLRTVIDNIPDRVYVKDSESRFVLCNEAVVRHEGQSSADDVVGETDFDFYPREMAERFLAEERRVMESGEPLINREGVSRDAADEEFCVLATKVLLRDSSGKVAGVVGITRDITERKKAEQQLADERNLLRTLIDNLSDEIYVKDSESRFVQCNKAVAERAGVETVEELIGKTDFDFYPEEDAKHFYAEEQTVIRTGEPLLNHEELRVDKAGNEIWASSNKAPLRDSSGKAVGIVGINRDITQRKRAEDQLIRLKKVSETITRVNQDMFRIKDRKRLLEKICERIVEHAYRMVWIGFCDEQTKRVIPEAQAGFEDRYLELIKVTYNGTEYGGGPIGTAILTKKPDVMRFIATDARYEPWREEALKRGYHSSAAVPLFRGDEVIGALNVYAEREDAFGDEEVGLLEELAYDISTGLKVIDEEVGRKKAEERLFEYQGRLKSLASQLTLAEERQRRRIAGELHDTVSQTLALAKIKVDALRAGATSQEPKEVLAEVAESLGEAISKTRSLTFDLSYPILYELGFEAAVEEWLDENVGHRYGIKTEFYDDGSEKLLDDDVRVLLFRNVRELLTNVVKHSNAKEVKVSVRKIDDEIQVAVEDNGVGFDVEQQAATAGRRSEYGLLSIRERLEDIGGKLEIESSPGGGCTVTMAVPVNNNEQIETGG